MGQITKLGDFETQNHYKSVILKIKNRNHYTNNEFSISIGNQVIF